jgi:hypothetical protein
MKTFLLTVLVLSPLLVSGQPIGQSDSGPGRKGPHKDENWFSAAICHGANAKTEWMLTGNNSPTPACITGTDVIKGVLDFDDNEDQSAILPFTLPPKFTGNIDVKIMWQPASTIGSVGWCVELIPSADLKRDGGVPITKTAHNCASADAKKSPQHKELVITLAAKAPAATNDVLRIRLSRDANSSVVLDDMPGNARLIGVGIETHEAPRQAL